MRFLGIQIANNNGVWKRAFVCVAWDGESIQADNGVRIETAALGFFFLSLFQVSSFNLTFWMLLFFFHNREEKGRGGRAGGWVGGEGEASWCGGGGGGDGS